MSKQFSYKLTDTDIYAQLLNSKEYNRDDWFYGSNEIKKWTGYSLGYDSVRQFMQENGEKNPAKIVDVPAKDFLENYDPHRE